MAEALFTAIGLGEGAASPGVIVWATHKLLTALARQRPLVLVLDDLHHAEPVFLDLVEGVMAQPPQGAIVAVASAAVSWKERL